MKRWLLSLMVVLSLSGCGYNEFQKLDEASKSAWSEVLNQYQRRADLIPNIVATVKGEANFEQETLTKVVEARAKATSIQVTPETLNNPEAFNKFQQAQGELSGALSRLMVVAERYPTLQANQAFRDLRVTLEGTENRITVARNNYIKTVQEYNVLARSFPTNITAKIFSYEPKATFSVQNEAEISKPPTVDFSKPAQRLLIASAPDGPARPDRHSIPSRLSARSSHGCSPLHLAGGARRRTVLPVPALTARVIDQTGTLDATQRQVLEAKLADFEKKKGSQIVVLMVPTTAPEDIASYANRVANAWKIGRKQVGDGILVVVAKNDRKMRIEVAKALEGAVPDLAAARIIDNEMKPRFRNNDFAGGLSAATDQLIARISGEALPGAGRQAPPNSGAAVATSPASTGSISRSSCSSRCRSRAACCAASSGASSARWSPPAASAWSRC